jgi:hypothetical protein
VRCFSHWISSSVKNIQAHSGLAPYLLAMTIKGEAWYFSHWISSSVKNIQAHSGLGIITHVAFASFSRYSHSKLRPLDKLYGS